MSLLALATELAANAQTADSEWKLVWEDSFDRPELGPDWITTTGEAAIRGGQLELKGGGGTVLVARPFQPDVRFEFDAVAAAGAPPCDLSATIGGNPVHGYGYLLAFGGQNNRVNQLLGHGVRQVDEKPPFLIQPGVKYHIVAQAEGGRFTYVVNGARLLDATVKDPALGPGFDRLGLVTWNGMQVDHFKVHERVPRHPDTPVYPAALPFCGFEREGRKLRFSRAAVAERSGAPAIGDAIARSLQAAVEAFNAGDLSQAQGHFRAAGGTLGLIGEAYVVCDLDYQEKQQFLAGGTTRDFQELADRFTSAARDHPDDALLAAHARAAACLPRLVMARSGQVAAVRLTALGPDNNPYYYKARFYEARYHYWNGMEGGRQRLKNEARNWMADLKKIWPAHSVLRQYTGELVPWGEDLNADTNTAPAWAAFLRETYARSARTMERFFARQAPDGQLGGGYGDDCELMRTWMPVSAISTATSETTSRGITRLAEGIWRNECKDGFSAGIGDVEHSSEPSADMFPGMLLLRYGDPVWVERNLRSCKTIKERFMAIDRKGYPRFLSAEFGADGVRTGLSAGGDTGYHARPMKHFIWQAWWGTREARDWFVRWADGWRAATMAAIGDKIPGMIPPSLWYPSGEIHPPGGWKWHDAKANYYGCPGLGGMVMDTLLAAAYFTSEDRFLRPFQLQMDYATSGPLYAYRGSPPAAEWQKSVCYDVADPQKIQLYRSITGERVYDEYLLRQGSPLEVYRVTGNLDQLAQGFERLAASQRHNLELATTEVLSTDRAVLPGALDVFGAYTGAVQGMRDAAAPTFAVTYDAPDPNFAALVTEATPQRLRVRLFTFRDANTTLGLRLWQLAPGDYTLNQGAVMRGEHARQNRYGWIEPRRVKVLHRADTVSIEVPPRKEWVVDLRIEEPIQVPTAAPDLALGPEDVRLTRDGLQATIHNLGNADARSVTVALQQKVNGAWQPVAEQKLRVVPAPKQLSPSTRTLVFKTRIQGRCRLWADPADKLYELCEANNSCEIDPDTPHVP